MKWIKLVPIIGIVLFIFILSRLDLAIIWQIYTKINITFLGLSLATLILTTFIKALKWNELIKLFSISYPIKKSMSSWLVGFFLSLITPAKIGDFARSFYLKKDTGLSFGKSLTTVIIDRLFEVGCLFIFGIIGVFYIIEEYGVTTNMPITLLIIFMFLVCGILVSFNKKIQESVIKSLFMFLIPVKYKKKMSGGFDDFFSGMSLLQKNKKILIKFSFLTVISWFIVFLQYWFLSIALGLGLTYLLIFIILSVVTLTEILPISFSGIGTRDVAMILLFSFVNIHPANAVAFSIAMLLVIYIHGFFGMIFFIKNPIKLFNKSELKMSTVHT